MGEKIENMLQPQQKQQQQQHLGFVAVLGNDLIAVLLIFLSTQLMVLTFE